MTIVLLVVFPLISYLVVKKGADIRKNATYSSFLHPSKEGIPPLELISHRGDTITNKVLKGKVSVLEFIDHTSVDLTNERHPLFELQEAYKGKTLSLRMLSVWSDSTVTATVGLLNFFATRFAVRENWHVLSGAGIDALQHSIAALYNENLTLSGDDFFPHSVYLINKEGKFCGAYDPMNKAEFDALFNDVLYLIDQ